MRAELAALVVDSKLAPEWSPSLGAKSIGSITATAEGSLLIQAEPRMHALVRRDNTVVGSDRDPLFVSVHIKGLAGCDGPTMPGLCLYWDNHNYLSIKGVVDGNIYWTAVAKGAVVREQPFWGIVPELPGEAKKWREVYLRIQLIARNAAFFISPDGLNWQKLGEAGCRPGPAGQAPGKVILGRGWVGERDGKPGLSNDYYPDGNKTLIKVFLSDFHLTDSVPLVTELPNFVKRDTWERTLESLTVDGIPRSWAFLGPVSVKDAQYKKSLSPDSSDDWTVPHKDATGKVIKSASWSAPGAAAGDAGNNPGGAPAAQDAAEEDALDGYVDLSEHVGQATQSIAWAKTEVQWPVTGPALLWFSSGDPVTLYVNNRMVYADPDEWQERRAVKDRCCVPVALAKGKNTVKLRYRQNRGGWGFFLRLERTDPGYRVRLLEKMVDAFADQEASAQPFASLHWRVAHARHEIPRCYEALNDYRAALTAYDKAVAAFTRDDENRLQAFESKLRLLEFLRDADTMVKSADEYLAAYPGTVGVSSAVRAALRGEVLAGKGEAAQARAKRFCTAANTSSAAITRTYRDLATAFKEAGDNEQHLWSLDFLSDQTNAEPMARAQAAIESAVCRWALERERVVPQQKPADTARLALACRSAAKALALLPGGKNPMAAALAQEAEADLKAGKAERAMAGYWGSLLLALCASDPGAAAYLSLSHACTIEVPQKGKDNKPLEDPVQFRKLLWKAINAKLGDPVWTGKWRFVGFTLEPTANIRTPLEPERAPDKADYGQGRRWQDLDLDQDPFPDVFRGNHDLGIDLRRWSGNAQVGYVTREFDVTAACTTTLRIGACSSWFAWLDGNPVGEDTTLNGFRFESSAVKLDLAAGKHRLLLKLEAPAEGPFAFRLRLSNEPELALQLLVQALTIRQFPRALPERQQDLMWICQFMAASGFLSKQTGNDAPYALATVISQLFADNPAARLQPIGWALDRMRESADSGQTVATLRNVVDMLDTAPWYYERNRHIHDLSLRLFFALVAEGRPGASDAVLRSLCNRYPDPADMYFQALTLRGSLRRDFGQNLGALPFYEQVMRDNPLAWKTLRPAAFGLEWAKTYRPERLLFETSHEVQAVLDAIRRQLAAGGTEDIERAMRNVTEILVSAPGSLNRVVDSPYYARFVGVREYIRALLGSLSETTRDVYRKVVAVPSKQRLTSAAALNDIAGLESLANEFYYTPAAEAARNRVGNLYLDRGQFAQAASTFQLLLKQSPPADKVHAAILYAKLTRALLGDGQFAAAETLVERLRAECAAENLPVGGETMTGMRLAERLKQELARRKTTDTGEQAADSPTSAATYLGNLSRSGAFHGPAPTPGPVIWAHPLVPQAAMETAPNPFEVAVRSFAPSFPATADGRVFATGLQSVRAIELESGRILWTHTWGSGGPLLKGPYTGYPVSCPTVHGGYVYQRALESGIASIRCYAAETGKLRWNTGAVPELKKLVWLSDPTIAYNLAFAVFLEPSDMNTHGVAALDVNTGRLRWKVNLVTGATGIKIAEQYQQPAVHLGPPAVDGGELYVNTGLSSVAALNAFSGEVKWVSAYPRMQFADPRSGSSWAGYDLRLNVSKAFARGPLSPIVADDLILMAPKDACGFLALDRLTGAVRWQLEFADCRYLVGVAGGNVLLCDDGVVAIDLASGRPAWEYGLPDQHLYGQPTLSGGLLYIPTEGELQRVDARTGRLVGSSHWDSRIGPLANLTVTPKAIVGVGQGVIAALGLPDAKPVSLPLYEARELEAAGKLEASAAAYEKLLTSKDMGEVMHALTARTRLLEKLGKRDVALSALEQFERDAPEMLSSFSGLWQVKKEVFARSLRSRLEQSTPGNTAPPEPDTAGPAGTLAGILTFAWHVPGDNCALFTAADGPRDRCFVQAGSDIHCIRIGTLPELVWRNYAGPGFNRLLFAGNLAAAAGDYKVTVFDRTTGEHLSEILAPQYAGRERQRPEGKRLEDVALADNAVVAATDSGLCAWDAPSGRHIWTKPLNWLQRTVPGGLAVSGGRVFKVEGVKDQRKNEAILDVYDLKTGNELPGVPLGNRGNLMQAWFSPDRHRLLYRCERTVICADTEQMKKLWQADLPRLEARSDVFTLEDGLLRYSGVEGGKWHMLWLNADTGKDARPRVTPGISFRMNGEYVVLSNDWYRTITRQRAAADKAEKVWEVNQQPEAAYKDHTLMAALAGQNMFHLFYVRSRGGQDQFIFRTFSWESGQLLNEQLLPGIPVRLEDNTFQTTVLQRGNMLLYNAREGVFAYAAVDAPAPQVTEQLRAELARPDAPPERRRNARRALLDLQPASCMAFLAPAETRVDGDLAEWQSTEPMLLDGPLYYVPLADTDPSRTQDGKTTWTGPEDLSAKLYLGWNRDGLALAVDVTDNVLVAPQPGVELTSGDCLRVIVDSRPDPGSTLDRGEDFTGTLAWVGGRSVLDHELGTVDEAGSEPQGRVVRAPNGKGYRYELMLPWALIRKDPGMRPGWLRDLRMGVAVYDNDGAGVKGALELGAGTTTPTCIPQWLCQVTLLDISHEKIERYRQVMKLVPGSDEARRFLELILLSKRGDKAGAERAAELEGFITAHPSCSNALRATGQLRSVYQRLGGADPEARLRDFLQRIKAPPLLLQAVSGAAFKFWVRPDPKNPPQMIMLQFLIGGGWMRAYWGSIAGTPVAAWGKDGTREMFCCGPLPKLGDWTELSISPFDLGIEGVDIKEMAFTAFGGMANFDRAATTINGQEKVLIDDAWPPNMQFKAGQMKLVDQPRHDGAKSWTFESGDKGAGVSNAHLALGNGAPIVSFAGMLPPAAVEKTDPAAQQALFRKVANIIPDTPEGFVFLQRAMDLHTGDGPTKTGKCVDELKAFLKANPTTPNANAMLKQLHSLLASSGVKNPRVACEDLLEEYKLPRDVRRAFFNEFAPVWSEWYVVGPFAAQGERRGLDTVVGPERGVDMAWKTVNASGIEVGWKKISNRLGPDKKPNWDPVVDMRRHLSAPKAVENKSPYFGFAYSKFSVPTKRRGLLLFGAQDMVSIWLNGKRVVNELETQAQKDKEAIEVQLRSGENEILIKVGVSRDQRLGFVFRLADLDGRPFPDVQNE